MYTTKKNVLQLVSLMKSHGIRKVVLCPGSRDIPLVHSIANCDFFTSYAVTDERSAGFFALGLSLESNKSPVAVVVTSGSALLNLHPAVSEAFYQEVPLLVISADRPAAWIGQMDGQTLPQPNVFGKLVKYAVDLREVQSNEDEWYCNRLANEALLELEHHTKGPVHINVPISDPFFDFSTPTLPAVRVIKRYDIFNLSSFARDLSLSQGEECTFIPNLPNNHISSNNFEGENNFPLKKQCHVDMRVISALGRVLSRISRIILVLGQGDIELYERCHPGIFERLKKHMLVVGESISNLANVAYRSSHKDGCGSKNCGCAADSSCEQAIDADVQFIDKIDLLMAKVTGKAGSDDDAAEILKKGRPELVITVGGHIISKRFKKFIRQYKPSMHFHVSEDGAVVDLYGVLTHVLEMPAHYFLNVLDDAFAQAQQENSIREERLEYLTMWSRIQADLPVADFDYSQMQAIGKVIDELPTPCVLHLANSSTVRYAQLFNIKPGITVMSNRGVNGIEGSLSTAIGYAAASKLPNFIFIGDLSFFYDMTALWNDHIGANVHILLLNNSSGEIFHALPGLRLNDNSMRYVTAPHHTTAEAWAKERGFEYDQAFSAVELECKVANFVNPNVVCEAGCDTPNEGCECNAAEPIPMHSKCACALVEGGTPDPANGAVCCGLMRTSGITFERNAPVDPIQQDKVKLQAARPRMLEVFTCKLQDVTMLKSFYSGLNS